MNKNMMILSWVLRILAALIMIQTLYFKFTGDEESVYIFTTLGMEPVGRIGSGVAELVASILLLNWHRAWVGGLLGAGIMAGAILSHLAGLGIEVAGDNGQLFIYAVITLVSCLGVVWIHRREPLTLIDRLTRKNV